MKFFQGPFFVRINETYGLRWYSLLITIAVIIGLILLAKEFKRKKYKVDDAYDMMIWTVICGFIGARLYYVAMEWSTYASKPISALYIWEGGLAIYGGVIGGALAVFVFSRIKKYKMSILADMAIPSLVLGQAIGRWGNFFNQEAFGMPVTNAKLQFFPYAVKIDYAYRPIEYMLNEWFQATFFYESMACLIIFGLLFLYRKRQKFNGELVLLYLFLYGIERSIVEGFRTDSLYIPGTEIRVSQALSIALILISVFLLAYNYSKVFFKKKNHEDNVIDEENIGTNEIAENVENNDNVIDTESEGSNELNDNNEIINNEDSKVEE